MSSKILGAESNFFAELAVSAALRVKLERDGKSKCPISNIHILKSHGKSSLDSTLVEGFALNCSRASAAMPTRLPTPEGRKPGMSVKIAMLDFNLQKHKLQMGVQIVVSDTKQVEEIRQREMDITREKIQAILETGARVILTTKGIDDLCMKYFVEAGAIAVRRVKKEDLKRIAKATGGEIVVTMADMEGNEVFDPKSLGECEEVAERAVGDSHLLYFSGPKVGSACTVVLRGANEFMLDEMDRALHDSLCVIKRIIESNSLVAGGGAVEAALSIYLEETARTMGSKEQLAVAQFAEALLVIPRTLTVNAAHDATELVARLRAHHHRSQEASADEDTKKMRFSGLDLYKGESRSPPPLSPLRIFPSFSHPFLPLCTGEIRNNLEAGVVEPAISKIKSLRFATEAAISILRIDDMIKLNVHKQERGGR